MTGIESRSACSAGDRGVASSSGTHSSTKSSISYATATSDDPQHHDSKSTDLFVELNEMLSRVICSSPTSHKGINDEDYEDDFEDSTPWVVLMGRLDISSNDG